MRTPGIYQEPSIVPPSRALRTGVPAFIGLAATGPVASAGAFRRWRRLLELLALGETEELDRIRAELRLADWPGAEPRIAGGEWPAFEDAVRVETAAAFRDRFGPAIPGGFVAEAVRAFFANGGTRCYVLRVPPGADGSDALSQPRQAPSALRAALDALDELLDVDLVCAPDLARPGMARELALDLGRTVAEHCERRRMIALLDALPNGSPLAQAAVFRARNAALYHPWVRPTPGPDGDPGFVPPCGHVAGVIARTDARVGVHRAPANETLAGVVDVAARIDDAEQGPLNAAGVNVIRPFPGRGVRVWGARTLADPVSDRAWISLPVRRMFLTAARWMELCLEEALFEPAGPDLWTRIEIRLSDYFGELFRLGALRGATPEEAFFVRCDEATNPAAERNAGRVTVMVGLAPASPNEFVVVHLIREADGVTITGPSPG